MTPPAPPPTSAAARPDLTLHSTSLTAHSQHLSRITDAAQALSAPPPPAFHGPHAASARRQLLALLGLQQRAAATLSALAPAASEAAYSARPLPASTAEAVAQRASQSAVAARAAAELGRLARSADALVTEVDDAAGVVGAAEREFSASRSAAGDAVLRSEEGVLGKRGEVIAMEKRVCELDGVLEMARREERRKAGELLFARCCAAVAAPARSLGVDASAGVKRAVAAARKARDIVDRASRDRLVLLQRRAELAREFIEQSAQVRKAQRALLMQDACVGFAVEQYAALRSLSASLREIAAAWDSIAECCLRVAEECGNDVMPEDGRTQAQVVERWHTISVALRLFHANIADSAQAQLKLFAD